MQWETYWCCSWASMMDWQQEILGYKVGLAVSDAVSDARGTAEGEAEGVWLCVGVVEGLMVVVSESVWL